MELTKEQLAEILKKIELKRVFSTNILALGYDTDLKILRVLFKGNSSYLYFNVEPEIYDSLIKSESKGKTLRESIIRQPDKYKFIKI